MADSRYRQLQGVDDAGAEHEAQIIDAETCQYSMYSARAPCSHIQDQARQHFEDSSSSESTAQANISANEGHLSSRRDPSQHDTPLLSDYRMSNSSAPVEIGDVQPEQSLQRRSLNQSAERTHPTWTEFYLRPLFLISLAVFLISTIAVLEVLRYISQQNQGLVTASKDMHYAWTYGPTFVLTMVATLWGQLEQRIRQIMPWCLMSFAEATAQNGLMLNYITSSTLGSLFRSFKRKHFLVSIGILGSQILRLTIIFASGLLRLEYRSLALERVLVVEDIFDPGNWSNPVSRDERPGSPILEYWAILNYDLPYPHGTTSQFALQSLISSDDGTYDTLKGEIQVFESFLENCTAFEFAYNVPDSWSSPFYIQEVAPGYLLSDLRPWCYDMQGEPYSLADVTLDVFLNLTWVIYNCANSTSFERQDHRVLVTLQHWLSYDEFEVSGLITRYDGVQDDLSIGDIAEILDLGIQPFNMTDKIIEALNFDSYNYEVLNFEWNMWCTMLNATHPQNDSRSFRNASLLIELSQHMWMGLAAYMFKHECTIPSNQTIRGTVTSIQGRLCVQELSLRLVEAHILLLVALITALYFLRPGSFHRNPTSLGAHSMILARSPDLMDLLQGYGEASKQALWASLVGYLASFPQHLSPESPAITIHEFRGDSEKMAGKSREGNSDPREWWYPVSVRWWFRVALITAVVAVIATLEVLLQVSDRRHGLGDVGLDGYLRYTWNFVPTLVLVLVGLLFSMVDFTARTLHAFQVLRKGQATVEDMLHDPARHVSLMAVGHSLWKRHFVLLLAMLPSLVAPILTIIASGLYMVAPVPWTYDAELELKDWFRPRNRTVDESNTIVEDGFELWTTFELTQFSNMSYPKWTHGQYAFASFGTNNLHSHDGNNTSLYITARVPATHVNLNCSMIGHYANDTHLTTGLYPYGPAWLPVDPRPLGCHTPHERNRTEGQRDLYLSFNSGAGTVFGKELMAGYYIGLLEDDYATMVLMHNLETRGVMTPIRVCGDKRQHYFIGLGYKMEALSVLHCVPYVEALWVTAAFRLPELTLVSDVPVSPDRDSAVFFSDAASMTAFPTDYHWKILTEAIVNGTSGLGQLPSSPPDPDSNDTRRVIAAVENTLAEYLAQNLHLYYRQPVGDNNNTSPSSAGQNLLTADGHPATGTVTDRTRLRLIQNAVSTRILQSLLGAMGACLIASTALGRGARVIPRDPGSIASRMAYFADGEIWRHVPVGADRWTDEQIKKHGLGISGGKLLLDWWGDDREDSGDEARGKKFAVDSADRKEMS